MQLKLLKTDITQLEVEAIVNAANSSLMGGGGVDGAIHRVGGPAILEACKHIRKKQGPCPPGQAVITPGGKLPAQYVIHTVGPIWKGGHQNEAQLLANCYTNSLKLAQMQKVKSIAFPNISTGVYGYPKQEAAKIAIHTVKNTDTSFLTTLIFACYDAINYNLYNRLLQ